MKLTNRGPLDLDRVDVETIPAHRLHKAAIKGIYDHQTGGTATMHETGRLRRGEWWTFEVIPARYVVDGGHELDRGGTAAFRSTSHAAGHEPWVDIVSVVFPPALGSTDRPPLVLRSMLTRPHSDDGNDA